MARWLGLEISLDFYEFIIRLNKESLRFLGAFKFFKLNQTGLDSDLLRNVYFRQRYNILRIFLIFSGNFHIYVFYNIIKHLKNLNLKFVIYP